MDAVAIAGTHPSVAWVCMEVDLLKSMVLRVWIGNRECDGFWQPLIPEYVPLYCSHCYRQGHNQEACHVLNPDLKQKESKVEKVAIVKLQFCPKSREDGVQPTGSPRAGGGSSTPLDAIGVEPSGLMEVRTDKGVVLEGKQADVGPASLSSGSLVSPAMDSAAAVAKVVRPAVLGA